MTSLWPFFLLLLVLIVGIGVITARKLNALSQQLRSVKTEVGKLTYHYSMQEEALHEIRTGSLGMGRKVKEMDAQLQNTQAKTEQLAEQDPETKMYTMANKMLESGASIEDLMTECDLPRAEAELMFNMHQQNGPGSDH